MLSNWRLTKALAGEDFLPGTLQGGRSRGLFVEGEKNVPLSTV